MQGSLEHRANNVLLENSHAEAFGQCFGFCQASVAETKSVTGTSWTTNPKLFTTQSFADRACPFLTWSMKNSDTTLHVLINCQNEHHATFLWVPLPSPTNILNTFNHTFGIQRSQNDFHEYPSGGIPLCLFRFLDIALLLMNPLKLYLHIIFSVQTFFEPNPLNLDINV